MSTSAQVSTALKAIFDSAAMQLITTKAHPFLVTELSEFELSKLTYNQEIHFFEYVVHRTIQFTGTNRQGEYQYLLEVNHIIEKDTKGVNYLKQRDAMDVFQITMISITGYNWSETVDWYQPQNAPPTITTVLIGDTECFRANWQIQGFKKFSS
jgi:hypothetical protein